MASNVARRMSRLLYRLLVANVMQTEVCIGLRDAKVTASWSDDFGVGDGHRLGDNAYGLVPRS